MRKLEQLKKEAREACEFRGHRMSRFSMLNKGRPNGGTWASAYCLVCFKTVFIDTKPLPNGIDISGEAVALSCED